MNEVRRARAGADGKGSPRFEDFTIEEDAKEGEIDEEKFPIYPYERLKTSSDDPVSEIDVTKREVGTHTQK